MLAAGGLLLVSRYGDARYGVAAEAIAAVLRSGGRPLVTVSPDAATRLVSDRDGGHWAGARWAGARWAGVRWAGAFIDARDDLLDQRLAAAGRPADDWDRNRRTIDRAHAVAPLVLVDNGVSIAAAAAELRRTFGLAGPVAEAPDRARATRR
jgi:hypothetical protein